MPTITELRLHDCVIVIPRKLVASFFHDMVYIPAFRAITANGVNRSENNIYCSISRKIRGLINK